MTVADHYKSLYESYEWFVPSNFNIADACCHRWAVNPQEVRQAAIFFEDQVGQLTLFTYKQLSERVNKLANGLVRMGIQPQDRVLIILQHSSDSAVSLLAALTVGAIAVPVISGLSTARYAEMIHDSQAKVAIVDKHTINAFMSALDNHSPVRQVIGVNTDDERVISMRSLLARQSIHFAPVAVSADTPAIMFYPTHLPEPKFEKSSSRHATPAPNPQLDDADVVRKPFSATVLTHQTVVGSLPGFVASQDWFPKNNDIFWSSYDWNSPYGMLNALLPVLYFGRTIVGCPSGRTIPRLFTLLEHYQVSNILTSAYELERIRSYQEPLKPYELAIRCITVPATEKNSILKQWVYKRFKAHLNGVIAPLGFGYIAGDSPTQWPEKSNSLGHVYPGHDYEFIDENHEPVKTGQIGELAIYQADIHGFIDPALSFQYWQQAQLFETIPPKGWFRTGIFGYKDNDDYIYLNVPTLTTDDDDK